MGLGMPIPDLSNKPGPGRPGWGPTGSYAFQFEVSAGQVGITVLPRINGLRFTIKWQDGTEQAITSAQTNLQSPTTQAGIISINNEELDTTWCDDFRIASGQSLVTKVISWGQNPWNRMDNAFSGCTSLSDISTTKFIADSGANIIKMFNGCTSLLEADIKNWDLSAGVSWYGGSPFSGLVNLQKLDMTGMIIKLTARSDNAFSSIGSATTNGCEFLMSNIDWSTTTSSGIYTVYWFTSAKFKDESNLSGWKFPSSGWAGTGMFNSARVIGNNAVLDVSGWTTYSGSLFPSFSSFNSGLGNTGAKIDISNIGLSNVTSMSTAFQGTSISKIIGLSTWGATAGNVNMFRTFWNSSQLNFSNDDNFSNTFITSLTPSNFDQTFMSVGVSAPNGKAPNITNIDFSGISALSQSFYGARFTNVPDLASATFSSSPTSFSQIFSNFRASDANSHLDFSNTTFKPSSFSSAFRGLYIDKLTFGSNVDFSSLTNVTNMFYYPGTPIEVKFPTNADFSSLASTGNWFAGLVGPTTGPLTTCQIDNLIRRFRATAYGNALGVNFYQSQVTEAPSVVQAQEAELVSNGWSITTNSTDATLPFAYASYAVDPTGITTISPTTTPPAGSVFTATNGLTISSSGVITINTFRGGSTIRCTYPDGCYNEVVMLIQVPFVMRIVIPSNGSTTPFTFKPQMSAGECFIDWGDTTETLTGNTTHNYPAAGSDTTYDIKVFDSPSGSKFTGMSSFFTVNEAAAIDKSIMKWGEIEWQNNVWFYAPSHNQNKLRISAPSGAANKPNLSQVTSLQNMFGVGSKGPNQVFEDVNNNLADWDVSTITNMQEMFSVSGAPVNRPSDGQPNTLQLSNWDVSNVTNFSNFSYGALLTANGVYVNYLGFDMTNWDTSEATNMAGMFYARGTLMGVENFNTSNVTDMNNMFSGRPVTGIDFKTKLVNGTVRWSVKKVTNFSGTFRGYNGSGSNGGGVTNSTFPTNWWISGEGQDVRMDNMFGSDRFSPGRFQLLTDNDAFATKTIASGSSPYGSSYTAWDMSNTTTLANFAFSGQSQFNGKNYNISSWQISNKCTSLANMFLTYYSQNALYDSLDQDLGHWDISNVTSIGDWMLNSYPGRLGSIDFSTVNYNSLLDITTGWGQYASSVQSPVTLNMGTSQYSAGNVVNVTWGANINSSGTNTLKTAGFNLQAATSVGDIIYFPASVGATTTAYARITGYNSTDEATTTTTNWPTSAGSARSFQIYDSNAAKGRFALLEAGWTIIDGGAYIPFDSTELEIEVQNVGDTMRVIFQPGTTSTHIDWGDGAGFVAVNTYFADSPGYNSTGTKTIKINETSADSFPGLDFETVPTTQKLMLTKIKKWGTNPFSSWYRSFYGCTNITSIDDTASPNLSGTSSLSWAFSNMTGLTTFDFSNWSIPATLTNISVMFWRGYVISNTSFNTLVGWDVSNIQDFGGLFIDCRLMNANIANWDTSSATSLGYMFQGAYVFNQDISEWKTSNNTRLDGMFDNAYAFNQDINTKVVGSGASAYIAWDTSNVEQWNGTFKDARAFNQPIDKWEIAQVSSVQGMTFMFGRTSVFNQDLLTKDVTIGAGTPVAKTYVAWDVSYIQTFGIKYNSPGVPTNHGMFENNTVFNGDISNWDIPSTNARSDGKIFNRMFVSATAFNKDLSQKTITNVTGKGSYDAWDVSSATQLDTTFNTASSFDQNLSNWTLNLSATNFNNVFRSSSMSTNNYTDTIVGWANYVKNQTPDAPLNVSMAAQYGRTFDTTRTASGFTPATAGRARSFLTLDVTVSNGTGVNGVYYYNYATSRWELETDNTYYIQWNSDESTWDLTYGGSVQYAGSGGSEAGGPESSTSWTDGLTVVDSSKGWTISNDTITT